MSAHNLTDAEEAAIFGCSREEDVRDAINAILAARAAEADQDCTCRNDPLDNMCLIDVACPVHGMAVIRAERAEARSERLRGLLAKVRAEHEALWNQVDRDQHEAMEQLARADQAEAERDAAREQVRHMHDVLDRVEAERDAAREALARVEALADEWETAVALSGPPQPFVMVRRLRAALAQPEDEGAGA